MLIGFISTLFLLDLVLFSFDRYIWSFVCIVAQVIIAYFFVDIFHTYVTTQGIWNLVTEYVPIYLGIGILVAILKWFIFSVISVPGKIKEFTETFKYTEVPGTTKYYQFLRCISDEYGVQKLLKGYYPDFEIGVTKEQMNEVLTPKAKNYIDRITFWVLQWPLVVLSTLLEDIILKIGKWVSTVFNAMFYRMSHLRVTSATQNLE
jgi:hypothetical protein